MFSNCSSLTSLNLSNFKINSVTNLKNIFTSLPKLTSLDLSNFNNNITDMSYIFSSCTKLTSLDIKTFETSTCKDFTNMITNGFYTKSVSHLTDYFNKGKYCNLFKNNSKSKSKSKGKLIKN